MRRIANAALALSSVHEAADRAENDRAQESLAYLAQALRITPDSVVARNWVADLLLRKNWWLPLKPLQHKGRVNSAAFSADGRRVVTASEDNTAQVWEAETGKPAGAPLQHRGGVNSAAFSPDGRRVVTASLDHTAQVWEVLLDSGSPQDTSLLDLAEAVGGYRVNELASVVPIPNEEQAQRLDRLRQLAAKAPDKPDALAWFLRRFLPVPGTAVQAKQQVPPRR